ncbi:MAG TPA: tellurite resistance TerB family protein [Polyangiaceae bacterium]|nr:tellurite resistance TerB family protein [Polyangiaceae bacterium]
MPAPDSSLIGKVARQLTQAPAYAEAVGARGSLLSAAASSYGWKSDDDDHTQPTGFDPDAARLFEAMVEGAFLVANADGDFDDTEQAAFQHVVVSACAGRVGERQVCALLADLQDQLDEDGLQKRIEMVARTITRDDHAREVLRVSSLLAHVSGGVSLVEREVLDKLAAEFKLTDAAVEQAIEEAAHALTE